MNKAIKRASNSNKFAARRYSFMAIYIVFCVVLSHFPKGYPTPSIEWTKDSAKIVRTEGKVIYRRWTITLENLIQNDSGAYMCSVCNLHGCVNHTTELQVQGKKKRTDLVV